MKTILRRTLSVMLTVVMLVSCWVFAAPKANAAPSSGGKYYVTIDWHVDDDSGKDNQIVIKYKGQNGGTADQRVYKNGSDGNVASSNGNFSQQYALSGAPYAIWIKISCAGGTAIGQSKWWVTKLTVSPNSDYTTGAKVLFNGQWGGCKFGAWAGSSSGTCTLPSSYDDPNIGDKRHTNSDYDSVSGQAPALTTLGAIGGGASSLTLKTDGTQKTSAAFTTGTPKDQYGVVWNQNTPSLSSDKAGGTGFSNNCITAPSTSNRSNNYYVKITQTCGSLSNTKSVLINVFDYEVTFKNKDGSTMHTETIDYGGSATAPSSPTYGPDATYHYTFSSWSGDSYTSLTSGKQSRTVTANYTSTAHTWVEASGVPADRYKKSDANCTNAAVYYKQCTGCNRIGTATYTYSTALGHDWSRWTYDFTAAGHSGDSEHRRVCGNDASHIEYGNHNHETWNYDVSTVPSDVTLKEGFDPDGTTNPDGSLKGGEHFSICPTCKHVTYGAHSYLYSEEDSTPATCSSVGWDCYKCVCGKSYLIEVPAIAHTYGSYTTIVAATCTTAGSEQRTCSECGYVDTKDIPATGHDYYEIYTSPTNGTAGSVCYGCNNGCGKYWTATYDSDTYTPATEYSSLAQAKRNTPASAKVSPPKFNAYYNADINYNYAMRGASLKIAEPFGFTDRLTRQGLRFTASLHVPEGVDYSGDNNIVDFGFIYSQTNNSYVNNNINNLTLDNVDRNVKKIVKMSVKDNNADKGTFNGSNWTGVTAHADETLGGTTLTYNLVVNVKAYNWSENYCARAYVVYNYNGHEYTVYDSQFSSRSVEYIARNVIENVDVETPKVINYCQSKIVTPIDQGRNV